MSVIYSVPYDLIVADAEFERVEADVKKALEDLETTCKSYKEILETISETALVSGQTHDATVQFLQYVDLLCETAQGLGKKCEKLTADFLTEIDQADSYLYDESFATTGRDFTQRQFSYLCECLMDIWPTEIDNWFDGVLDYVHNILDGVGDYIYGKVYKIVDKLGWKQGKKWLQDCHVMYLDYNNATKRELIELFDRSFAVDKKYGFRCGHYFTMANTLESLRRLMSAMSDVIRPSNGTFTVEELNRKVSSLARELQTYYTQAVEIVGNGQMPDEIQISDFVSQPWSITYFSGFLCATTMFIADVSGVDLTTLTITQMFEIAKKQICHMESYNDYLTKKLLLESIRKTVTEKQYAYDESLEKDVADFFKEFFSNTKSTGGDIYKYLNTHRGEDGKQFLDGRTVEARRFRAFLKSLGNAEEIMKWGSASADYLARLFTDYTESAEILETLDAYGAGGADMQRCLKEVRALYEKEIDAWVQEGIGVAAELGYDAAFKWLAKQSPVVAVVEEIEKGIKKVGEVSGIGIADRNRYDALVYVQLHCDTNAAYDRARGVAKGLTPDSEGYTAAMEDLRNCFELNKQTMIKMFDAMAKAEHGYKQAYYRYCMRQVQSASMYDNAEISVLTYEQFLEQA